MKNSKKDGVHDYGYRTPRFPAAFRFLIRVNEPTPRLVDARCIDISEQGLAAQLTETLPVDSEAVLIFTAPGSAAPVRVSARIISQQGAAHGFTFLFSSQAERDQIHVYLSLLCSNEPGSPRMLPE